MLVAARDEDGTAVLICTESDADDTHLAGERGGRFWQTNGYRMLTGDEAEPFCRNIPPGEKRVIDMEKSVIVHVAPPKTPMEELVEACEKLREYMKHRSQCEADREIFSALSRVRQEQQEKGGTP